MLYLLGFIYLDFSGRQEYLLTHGRLLASRQEEAYEVRLYWTRHFFAEVHYSLLHSRNEKISAMLEKKPDFTSYLEHISLAHLQLD